MIGETESCALSTTTGGASMRSLVLPRRSQIAAWLWISAAVAAHVLFGTWIAQATEMSSPTDVLEMAENAFAERHIQERMGEAIALYKAVLPTIDPTETQSQAFVLNRLAQLCYEATTFTPGNTSEDRTLFEQGKAFGLQSLRLNEGFASAEADSFESAVSHVTDAAALLWTADNWGGLCGMSLIEGLQQFGKVRTLYERGLAVDEAYWGASAHNALGAMLVVTPAALGGDVDKGISHLERAVLLEPTYLLHRVVYAQYWGFTYNFFGQIDGIRDAAFIESELTAVLDEPIADWPFWNREALKEAEALLEKLAEMTP
jgi:hypothetical protein